MAGFWLRKFLKSRISCSRLTSQYKQTSFTRLSLAEAGTCALATIRHFLDGLYLGHFNPSLLGLPLPAARELPLREELEWDGFLWAVPKKRTSHSKKRMRSAHKYLKPRSDYITCPQCKNLKLLHILCGHCLKETMKKTAEIRQAELETKLQQMSEKLAKTFTKPS